MRIIDLSLLIEDGMPTCGTSWHQQVELKHMGTIETVGRNTHSILLGSHSGTHMDAPYHFIGDGQTIDMINLECVCGSVAIIDFRALGKKVVAKEDIEKIKVSERMLFVFGWYKHWKMQDYYTSFPFFSSDAITFLVDKGMRFMALDTPSPDSGDSIGQKEDSPNHKILLKNGIVIVEYLSNTDEIDFAKKYEIYALPLKIAGSDGSPCRTILKEMI